MNDSKLLTVFTFVPISLVSQGQTAPKTHVDMRQESAVAHDAYHRDFTRLQQSTLSIAGWSDTVRLNMIMVHIVEIPF